MRNTSEFSESEERELTIDISNVLSDTGAYTALYKLLVDRHEVILHSDMENLACDLEEYIFNWTKVDDHD